MKNFDAINDATGFANGDEFENDDQVYAYFAADAQRAMFGNEAETDAATLNAYAEAVIDNRWHFAS